MEQVLAQAKVKILPTSKVWDAQRAYEKKLAAAMSKDKGQPIGLFFNFELIYKPSPHVESQETEGQSCQSRSRYRQQRRRRRDRGGELRGTPAHPKTVRSNPAKTKTSLSPCSLRSGRLSRSTNRARARRRCAPGRGRNRGVCRAASRSSCYSTATQDVRLPHKWIFIASQLCFEGSIWL
jgi:hypothetical protein